MTVPDATPDADPDVTGPDARGRVAYRLEPAAADQVRRQVGRIMMFDHAAGAQAVADAEPCDVLYVTRPGGLGLDRQVSGFMPSSHAPLIIPPGLVNAMPAAARLVPDPGPPGDPWRDIIRRLEQRPRLSHVLTALGVPVHSYAPASGMFARARLVLDPADPDAPIMIGYRFAPVPVPTVMRPVPVWHFEIALEVLRGVGDTPGAPARPLSTDGRVIW